MDSYFGWEPTSNTASTYIHLQEKDMVAAVRKFHGLPVPEEDKKKAKITCQRCGRVNDANARFCNRCQVPLTLKTVIETGERQQVDIDVLRAILSHPEMMELFTKKKPT